MNQTESLRPTIASVQIDAPNLTRSSTDHICVRKRCWQGMEGREERLKGIEELRLCPEGGVHQKFQMMHASYQIIGLLTTQAPHEDYG